MAIYKGMGRATMSKEAAKLGAKEQAIKGHKEKGLRLLPVSRGCPALPLLKILGTQLAQKSKATLVVF